MSFGQKRKVLFLRSNPCDPDSRVEKECLALHDAGYDVSVFAWDRARDYDAERHQLADSNIPVYRVGIRAAFSAGFKKNILPLMKFQLALMRYLFKHKDEYDVIHACDFDTAFAAKLCNAFLHKAFVYDVFDYYVDAFSVPGRLRSIIERFDRWVIESSDLTILCTEERFNQIYPAVPRKAIVIHNSPPDVFAENEGDGVARSDSELIQIAYVGILSPGRMIEELLEVVSSDERFSLHIGGFGALEDKVKGFADSCDRIKFYGKMKYKDTLLLEMQSAVLAALYDPSIKNHQYAAPNKFYEALMLGKPLLVAKGTGIDSVVDREEIGQSIVFSKSGLAEGLDKLFYLVSSDRSIEKRCRKLYCERYSWNLMASRLINAYAEVLNEK